MPRGIPRFGSFMGSRAEELQHAPEAEVLGEIKSQGPALHTWDDPDLKQQIAMEEGPPPWERFGDAGSDARQFIDCPEDWVLYWINPRMLEAGGWRGWQPIRVNDPRVNLIVTSMRTPEGQVRRGGPTGDILAYMPKHWYDEKRKQYEATVARQTQASVDRMDSLREEFRRGTYGPNITLESATHPTHTIGDGRTMTDV